MKKRSAFFGMVTSAAAMAREGELRDFFKARAFFQRPLERVAPSSPTGSEARPLVGERALEILREGRKLSRG